MEYFPQAIYIEQDSTFVCYLLSTTLPETNLHIHAGLVQLMSQGINPAEPAIRKDYTCSVTEFWLNE